jgi:hypothetical protein
MLLGSSLGGAAGPAASVANALIGRFPAAYLEAPPGPGGGGDGGGEPATLVALEGVINRVRPLAAFQQERDRRRRPVGAHVTLVQHPMLNEASTHEALRTVYTAVTAGQARSLWPLLPKGPPRGGGGGGGGGFGAATALGESGPAPSGAGAAVSLAAQDANEAVLLQALSVVLPEQHVVAMSAMPGMPLLSSMQTATGGGASTGMLPSPALSSAQDSGASSPRGGPRAGRGDSDSSMMGLLDGARGELLPSEAITDLRVGGGGRAGGRAGGRWGG